MHLVFDISLTVAKPWLAYPPSGIDRVEFAHARHWARLPERDVTFVMRNAWDRLAAIPDGLARDIIAMASARLAPGLGHRDPALRLRPAAVMTRQFFGEGRVRLRRRVEGRRDAVLLTVSNASTHKHAALAAVKAAGCRFVPLVHDVIPLTHPHTVPAGEDARHARRMEGVSRFADAALVVSAAARDAMAEAFAARGWRLPPLTVAHPGLDLPEAAAPAAAADPDPYFVILGSVEPRKNHALLLELWARMARAPGCPRLLVIGRRPAEPHTGTALLDRGAFHGRVENLGRLPDAAAARLLHGARALLFPSLSEGFGIPVAEALAMGVPVLASDIPAFREVGGEVPEFLDPLDGPGWQAMVRDYAQPDSVRRAAQLTRVKQWQAPTWALHFRQAEALLDSISNGSGIADAPHDMSHRR